MLRRSQARQIALQILFQFDSQGEVDKEMAAQAADGGSDDLDTRQRALTMAQGAWENREVSDQWIERVAPQWPPRRQPGVDRNILRLAIWELTHADTPHKVIIDEAIELAKNFSTENSPSFVNGVLDAVVKEHMELIATKRRSDEATQG
jgi:N utilization substance protein B